MAKLIAIDAFCGCGGTSLGLSRAGFTIAGALEVEPFAAETYMLNHPRTPVFYDIRATAASFLLDVAGIEKGELDLLTGCPPCQGFSSIRTLNTSSVSRDKRNNLIFDFVRLVDGLRPKAVLLENVPGLMENWRFQEVVDQLKRWRYHVTAQLLDASAFGVPQRRKRLVMAASLRGEIDLSAPAGKPVTVRRAIGGLPPPRRSGRWLQQWHSDHSAEVLERIRSIPKNGGSRKDLGQDRQLDCHQDKKMGFHDVYGRMAWNEVAPTITRFSNNPSKGRFLHPTQNRALTLLESAILQSFPRSYKFLKDTPPTMIASMIGEAFPPKMAEILATRIADQLRRPHYAMARGAH
jgi:DNA (cytosine-5)-methyltransferase 1